MLEKKSTKFSFSVYDWYGSARGLGLFILSGLVTNIGGVETQLNEWGVSTFLGTMILWAIVDLGRRFLRDYKEEK